MTESRGTAIITGGPGGIGRAICAAMAAAGFDLAIVSLERPDEAAPALAPARAPGRKVLYIQADIAQIEGHDALLDRIVGDTGALTCLVNCAGVSTLRRGDLLELTAESFDRVMATNLRGTFFLTQAVARRMLAAAEERRRSLITISSANAEIVGLNRADYCLSKSALAMMSKLFAARLGEAGIGVFDIQPGIIRTEMTAVSGAYYEDYIASGGVPMRRWGTPEDVAQVVRTVATGGLPFTTGDSVRVGGGLHLHRV
jgi:NAD(P)-dependent dehydrogenase (short-subunit alcohol dehydrogenase family)